MNGIVYVIYLALTIYAWLIVARMLLSWVQLRPGGTAYKANKVLVDVTEPERIVSGLGKHPAFIRGEYLPVVIVDKRT